jgi:hypothetical protein
MIEPLTPASQPTEKTQASNVEPPSPTPWNAKDDSPSPAPSTTPPRWESPTEKFSQHERNITVYPKFIWSTSKVGGHIIDIKSNKPLDIIFVGDIVSADLEEYRPSSYDNPAYGVTLRVENEVKRKLISILENDPNYSLPNYRTPLRDDDDDTVFFNRYYKDVFNARTQRAHSTDVPPPFPGLRDGRRSHLLSAGHPLPDVNANEFSKGATVAVQARLHKYDFGKGDRKVGAILKLYAVVLLEEGSEEEDVLITA